MPGMFALRTMLALLLLFAGITPVLAQTSTPPPDAGSNANVVDALLKTMTSQQKIGQVFLVNFPGTDTSPDSDIANLINTYHIGGVQFKASSQNVINRDDVPVVIQTSNLANQLQQIAIRGETLVAWEATSTLPITASPILKVESRSVPLFIGIAQDNELASAIELPELSSGVTQVPNPLTIGATWKPQHARTVGGIIGSELSQMGVNLYFGPALDVIDLPRPGSPGDLGPKAFGGDPYWVAQFAAEYVGGLHTGSQGRMAVVARNFPGLGASDRNVAEEIPTVLKNLEQLKQNELQPFFAVTQRQSMTESVEGLQVTHIRYRGLEGSRSSTRPVSLDPGAYSLLMSLPEFAEWRQSGGVTFSEALGMRSVRRFYDNAEGSPSLRNLRRIARDAFFAGNDVLVLGAFGAGNTWNEQLAVIKDTISYFQNQYVDDANFASRVDDSVRRILTLKLKLYGGNLTLQNALSKPGTGPLFESAQANADAIINDAVTLLSPSARELPNVLPSSPTREDNIVFITDERTVQECLTCAAFPAIKRAALRDAAVRLYGPTATDQIDQSRTAIYSLDELVQYNLLNVAAITATAEVPATDDPAAITPTVTSSAPTFNQQQALEMQRTISQANWIIFSLLDLKPTLPSSLAFRRFLANQADTLKDKRVVVFAFGAPYYLDATEVGKIDAYYGIYGRTQAAQDAAARVLFREIQPTGASPVTVDATQYLLADQTRPDPQQTIPVTWTSLITPNVDAPQSLELKIGDKLEVQAGPVLDRNGHIVPDRTPAQFVFSFGNEDVEQPRSIIAETIDGVAKIVYTADRQGALAIRVESDEAKRSDVIRITAAGIEKIEPTPEPTASVAPTALPTATATPAPVIALPPPAPVIRTSLSGFLLTMLLLLGVGTATFIVLSGFRSVQPFIRMRGVLATWIIGWLSYLLYAFELGSTKQLATVFSWVGGPMLAGVFALLAFGVITIMIRLQRHEST